MERFQGIGFLPHPHQLDRLAGDLPDRQCRATTGIAVGLGQDHACERQGFIEGLGRIGRILASHGIHHEQGLVGRNRLMDTTHFRHHGLVHMQPAGRVDDQHIEKLEPRLGQGRLGDFCGILVRGAGKKGGADLLGQSLQLLDGGGTIDIAAHQQRFLALTFLEMACQLGGCGGLARALQTGQQDHHRGAMVEAQLSGLLSQDPNQLLIDHLDQDLARRKTGAYLTAYRPLPHLIDERFDHRQGNVRVQQRGTHLTQGLLDIFIGQPRLAAQLHQGSIEALGQILEHGISLQGFWVDRVNRAASHAAG